jgi:GDPmannose 4,6-dehydratase
MYFGKLDFLTLGNLNSKRDWGHSKDYVKAMWLMLQNDKPKDYVVATGKTLSVREFLIKCFDYFEIKLEWENDGINEMAFGQVSLKKMVQTSTKYYRPNEVDLLLGDSSLIRHELGWHPFYDIDMLIDDMIKTEIESR